MDSLDTNVDALLQHYLLLLDQYTTLRDEANKLQSSVRDGFLNKLPYPLLITRTF